VDATADPESRSAPGGEYRINVSVVNSGGKQITVDSLNDSVYGNLATRSGSNCNDLIGDVLESGAARSCSFTVTFTGPSGASQTSTVTVVATGSTVTDTDDVTIRIHGDLQAILGGGGGLQSLAPLLFSVQPQGLGPQGAGEMIVINNSNASSSSSSAAAAAAAAGATAAAPPGESKPAVAVQAPGRQSILARTGGRYLELTALALALLTLGFALRQGSSPVTEGGPRNGMRRRRK
jgi:hypothetical protein